MRAYHAFEGIHSTASGRAAALRLLLDKPEFGRLWLVYAENELAGYIALCLSFSIEFACFEAFIDEFYLQPDFRGQGLGSRVLERVKSEVKALGVRALHLEVARDNKAAQGLYQKAGLREERGKYVVMSLELE